MAYEIVKTKSIKATASLAASQYCFVKIDTSGQLALPSNGGDACGVLQDKPLAGDPGAVCYPGDITKVVAGAAFAAGTDLQSDASGNAVAAVTGSFILGKALGASTGATQLVSIIYEKKGSKL